jgi:hypothetical protein
VPQQVHLDIMVEDVAASGPRALALGATKLDGDHVYADPAGHPFCLIRRPAWAPRYLTMATAREPDVHPTRADKTGYGVITIDWALPATLIGCPGVLVAVVIGVTVLPFPLMM